MVMVFLQVYGGYHGTLFGAFVAIAICSVLFLWLEVIQVFKDWKYYILSAYNLVDLFVFGLPLAASINHFLILSGTIEGETPDNVNAEFLSFSVLFIFLHFLFELRINRSVCKFVTIITRIFAKIRMFFFIAAGGIIAFTIAMLHLLHSCPYEKCTLTSKFPSHFYDAVSVTLLFMGGQYDAVEDEFKSQNWSFKTMMMVFFFFTVILMLNVLIALINKAFEDGDVTWRLTWLENRLRVIESVENITYHIPGFREHYNWFPDEIYYSATDKEIENFRARFPADFSSIDSTDSLSQATAEALGIKAGRMAKESIQELTNELKQTREQLAKLQDQSMSSEKKSSALHRRNQQNMKKALQRQNAALQQQIGTVQRQNEALQRRMEDLHTMLSVHLGTNGAAGSA
ncbi:hypothetical protein BGZ51_002461 [Haplosporangium sp. Z 767]|nr:hypothetical protein BGZ51_002461 [Haplosporangium sp. Z 767]